MNNIAFIFARGGSKGIKNKNIIDFGDKPLIAHTIDMAKKSRLFKDIVVSTDSEMIKNISLSYGATVPFMRPNNLATDESSEISSWKHAISNYCKTIDIFVSLPCTSPLRCYKTINKMINRYKDIECDLLLGVTQSHHIPNFNIVNMNNSGEIELNNLHDKQIYRRQDAHNCYNITTYGYITSPDYIMKTKNLMDGNIHGYILDKSESIDIDDINDFKYAEYLYLNNTNE